MVFVCVHMCVPFTKRFHLDIKFHISIDIPYHDSEESLMG